MTYLEVEHAGRGGLADVLAGGDLVEGFDSMSAGDRNVGEKKRAVTDRRGRAAPRCSAWR